ncbi:hypothetical protein PFISCL1PPCAC_22014, partial [Pristionchus fissidentatus]
KMDGHNRFRRCQGCRLALSKCGDGNLLSCGHVFCNACLHGYYGNPHGKASCRWCDLLSCDVYPLPSSTAANSPRVLGGLKRRHLCSDHNFVCTVICACGQRICHQCTQDAHATHFGYAELNEADILLGEEISKMKGVIQALDKEQTKTVNKKKQVSTRILKAQDNIAANFSRIIAQAISRCLDL